MQLPGVSFEENSSVLSVWVVPAVAPNCRALSLCCLEKLVLVGGAAVGPDVCPQLTTGAGVRLVCTISSFLPGAGLTVKWGGPCLGYLHTARLVVLIQWDLAMGILARVDLQGA